MCKRFRAVRCASIAMLCSPAWVSAQHAADEVVVTAVPQARAPGDLGQSVTVLRSEALDRARAATLGETLAGQVGVSSSSFGAGASRPIVRGLAGARVKTLEDGVDSMDAASLSDDHAVAVDTLVAEQIEIFRGPTTLLYGSGAVGGVINTVTTRIPEAAPDERFVGAFELRGDTVADDRAAALRLDGGSGAFAWHFDALTRDSDDYSIPGVAHREHEGEEEDSADHEGEEDEHEHEEATGFLPNSAIETDAAALGVSWIGKRGFIGIAVSTFETRYGVPGHTHAEEEHEEEEDHAEEEHEEEEVVRIDLDQTRIDLKGGWRDLGGAIDAVRIRVGMNDYEHLELEGDVPGTRFSNEAYEGRVELVHRPVGAWSGAFGIQLSDRDFVAQGEEAFVPPVRTRSRGIFAVEELDADAWRLSFGARFESQEHRPSNGLASVDDDAASLSFAAIRELGRRGLSLALNAASAQRLPVAEELFADGPHLATGSVQVGDPSLGPETSRHFDVGLRKDQDGVGWGVTAFVTDFDDFIYLADTGSADPEHGLPVYAFVQDDARFRGIEAELFVPVATAGAGEIDMRLYGDYVRGELRNGEDLPRMPPLRFGARFEYHADRLVAGIEATRYDRQGRTAPLEEPTEGYTLLNADFLWHLRAESGPALDLFLNASNLRDVEARKHTSFVKDVAPLPGRNYSIGVRSRF